MENKEFLIVDANPLFYASKKKDYQLRVAERLKVFVDFMQENDLTTREILSADQPVTGALRIWSTDLTDDGMAVVKTGFDKWLRSLDKGTDVKNISILNNALKKVKSSK